MSSTLYCQLIKYILLFMNLEILFRSHYRLLNEVSYRLLKKKKNGELQTFSTTKEKNKKKKILPREKQKTKGVLFQHIPLAVTCKFKHITTTTRALK